MPENTPAASRVFSREWHEAPDNRQHDIPSDPGNGSDMVRGNRKIRRNWPLWVGSAIVLMILLIAAFGPNLARQDPMQEHTIIQVGDGWELPPFDPFTVPGFPIGSDQFGRDLLSRLLWAVRPTMTMVLIVACVRLGCGIIIGLGAGWFTGRIGHALELMISAALSVPVLMVALGAIALVGVELGLLAFIIGLSLNGWVETARLVRDQTILIKRNLYIEAARALGAGDPHILLRHVLRQIMPLIWMLFAFETSGTFLTTAGLGFLGYYIGGDVWIDVDDFVARRLSGMPELGQMLASAWNEQQILTAPWGMIIAGSAVFVAVLGFNLLGEGLRLRLSFENVNRAPILSAFRQRLRSWALTKGVIVVSAGGEQEFLGRISVRWARWGSVVVIAGLGLLLWRLQGLDRSLPVASDGGHLWAAARRDSHGTLWSPVAGLSTPTILWTFQDSGGFTGGPVVASDGTIFLGSGDGVLYALDTDGNVLWQVPLPGGAVGTPALGVDGDIYIADQAGSISTYAPDGSKIWHFQQAGDGKATTGPVVDSAGFAYYPVSGKLRAISPVGELLWEARVPFGFNPLPPLLSPSEDLVFYLDTAFYTTDGSTFNLDTLAGNSANEQYFMGADGNTYYRSNQQIVRWETFASGPQVVQNLVKQVPGHPRDTGITSNGTVWATYGVGYNNPHSGILWLNLSDQVLGAVEYLQTPNQVIGVGENAVLYTCGDDADGVAECVSAAPGAEDLLWRLSLEVNDDVVGGALIPDRLYVALAHGSFFSIGSATNDAAAEAERLFTEHLKPIK